MRKIYVLVYLFVTAIAAQAQVNRYQFTQTNGTYNAIAGTTVSFAGTTTGWDDNVTSLTIPFSFTFNGTGYTSVSLNSNGYVTFGATVSQTNAYSPISVNRAYTGAVSAFGRDMIANGTAITYTTLNSTPNRVFVIQWTNAQRYNTIAVAGDVLNFQIRLNETSNTIDIVYGTNTITSTTALTAQIGLRGAGNTDYSNRLTSANWGKTDLGQTNADAVTSSNTISPASGLTFRWTPASCAIPTTILVPAGNITSNSAIINWTAASPAPGSGYDWKITAPNSGSEGTSLFSGSVAAGILTATASGLTPSTTYAAYVRSNCSPTNSSWNGPVAFSTASVTPAITVSAATLSVTGYNQGTGPVIPAVSSFTTSGINLTAALALTATTNYEISTNASTGFGNSISLTPTSGTVATTTIYVRHIAGLVANNYNTEVLNATSTGATPRTVTLSGTIYQPNNDCSGATNIVLNPSGCVTNAGTSLFSTQSIVGCTGNADDDVWFKFDAVATGQQITVTPTTMNNVVIEVFSGSCAGLTSLGCFNNTGGAVAETAGVTGLTVGATYYIRVFSNGNTANAGTFSMDICTFPPPLCTTNISPANGATAAISNAGQVTLSWNSTASVINYNVYLGTTNPPTTLVATTTATSYVASLVAGAQYYWYVQPVGSSAASGCSANTTSFTSACLNATNGQYPTASFTPACAGATETIVTDGYAGEYSVVNVNSGTTYIFASSLATDFISISNTGTTLVYATGTGSASWTASFTGSVRFYLHTSNSCGESTSLRSRTVRCIPVPTVTSFTPSSGCGGSVSVTITGTGLAGATAVTIGGTPVTQIVSNTATQIVVIAGSGTTGTIGVITAGGTGTSAATFTVNPAPVVAANSGGAATVCAGSATPAFTNATAGGIWSITNGTGTASIDAAGIVTGGTAGTVTVLYTVTASGCTTSAVSALTVKAQPATPVVTPTSNTICVNSNQALTATSLSTNVAILSENFETFSGSTTANGWLATSNSTGGTPINGDWYAYPTTLQYNDGFDSYHYTSSDNSKVMVTNSDYQGFGGTTATFLRSPAFSTVNYTSATLTFEHFFWGGDNGRVQISTDGTNFTNLINYTTMQGTEVYNFGGGYYDDNFVTTSLAIPAAFLNQPVVYIRYRYNANYGLWWAIDNVKISGTLPNNISWTATPALNAGLPGTASSQLITNASITAIPTAGGTFTYQSVATANGCSSAGASSVITVTPQPDATFVYSGSPYFGTGTATASVSGTAGLTGGTYSSGAGLVFNNTSTGAIDLAASTPGTYTVTYNYAAAGGCTAYATTASITVNGNLWAGVDNNWFNAANWCAGIPTSTTNVVIPNLGPAGNYPIITTGTALSKNISIANNASVSVSGTGVYSLYGAATSTGTGNMNLINGTLDLQSGASIGGSAIYTALVKDVTISGSSSFTAAGGGVRVSNSLSFLTSGNTFTTNGNLTLLSTATNTASVRDITHNPATLAVLTGNTISGTAVVEKYIKTPRKWQYLSPDATAGTVSFQNSWMETLPVGAVSSSGYGMWITGIGGMPNFDAATSTPTIKWWDGSVYTGINAVTDNIHAYSAYMTYVRGDRGSTGTNGVNSTTTLRTRGTLHTGNYPLTPISLLANNNTIGVGNPYASAVDLRNINTGALTTPLTFYVWDPKLTGDAGLGGFQTLTGTQATGFTISPGGGSYTQAQNDPMNTIESGQGLFIQSSDIADLLIQFTEPSKVNYTTTVSFTPGNPQFVGGLLYDKTSGTPVLMDGLLVKLDNGYSNAADNSDANKMINTNENVSVKKQNKLLAVELRKPLEDFDTIHINIANMRVKNYQWAFNMSNMDETGRVAFLVDKYLGTTTALDLVNTNNYDFSVTADGATSAADRFMIVFKTAAVVPVKFTSIAANRVNGADVSVKWNTATETNIHHYELQKSNDGVTFNLQPSTFNFQPAANNGGSASYAAIDIKAGANVLYYRIKAISMNGQVQYSAVVKVGPLTKEQQITVYPNPIADRIMNLKFENKAAGRYTLQLVNSAGQTIHSSTINISSSNELRSVKLNATIPAGTYQLIIGNEGGEKEVKQIIIK